MKVMREIVTRRGSSLSGDGGDGRSSPARAFARTSKGTTSRCSCAGPASAHCHISISNGVNIALIIIILIVVILTAPRIPPLAPW